METNPHCIEGRLMAKSIASALGQKIYQGFHRKMYLHKKNITKQNM